MKKDYNLIMSEKVAAAKKEKQERDDIEQRISGKRKDLAERLFSALSEDQKRYHHKPFERTITDSILTDESLKKLSDTSIKID